MFTKEEPVTLENLGGGAAIEKFNVELQKLLDDIQDPNTKPDAVRSITLKVTVKPDEERNTGAFAIDCKATLAGNKAYQGSFQFGRSGKIGHAREIGKTKNFLTDGNVQSLDEARENKEE